ncbi:AlpA family transcriptional regulator [Rathayibacter sp. SD072]|uniref:helix-turn-helix transcriptional regulator n=1 Tax=Rathayibacter sp. SD072 TaxID=2781731 RepID=UPI001A95B4AC|nr:helix-turn-helix domain-containing protein [Rathayibacter sp. SD072]MBO0982320.1 helix-turn-helix domain-containing protein [Rathayibacter sp. SD072]
MTVADLAAELQIGEGTLYQLRNRNPDALPPAFKVEKYLRWRREDVDTSILEQVEHDHFRRANHGKTRI